MRLVLLSGCLVVCLSLRIYMYSHYHDREGRGRNTIAKTTIVNITSITMLNGHRQEPRWRMQCHATGREGVRGQDKHEKRRSGDLPIAAAPYPGRPFMSLHADWALAAGLDDMRRRRPLRRPRSLTRTACCQPARPIRTPPHDLSHHALSAFES